MILQYFLYICNNCLCMFDNFLTHTCPHFAHTLFFCKKIIYNSPHTKSRSPRAAFWTAHTFFLLWIYLFPPTAIQGNFSLTGKVVSRSFKLYLFFFFLLSGSWSRETAPTNCLRAALFSIRKEKVDKLSFTPSACPPRPLRHGR